PLSGFSERSTRIAARTSPRPTRGPRQPIGGPNLPKGKPPNPNLPPRPNPHGPGPRRPRPPIANGPKRPHDQGSRTAPASDIPIPPLKLSLIDRDISI